MLCGHMLKGLVVLGFVWLNNTKPRSGPFKPTMVKRSGLVVFKEKIFEDLLKDSVVFDRSINEGDTLFFETKFVYSRKSFAIKK